MKDCSPNPSSIKQKILEEFTVNIGEIKKKLKDEKLKKKTRKYYQEIIGTKKYLTDNHILEGQVNENGPEDDNPFSVTKRNNKRGYFASKVVLVWNIYLLILKIIACVFSKSMAMVTSTLDSFVDILSGLITYTTNYKIRRLNIYKFPQGKTRMVPLSIIIISITMAVSNLQVIIECLKRMISGEGLKPEFSIITLVIVAITIVSKFILYIYCSAIPSSTTEILAQDSRNDMLTNTAVLAGLLISQFLWTYGDCVFGLIITLYVFGSWTSTCLSNLSLLIGKSATPKQIQRYGWTCLLHDPENILFIDTIRAYTFGTNYLVEVDIVLNENMPLKVAHNIGESLQHKLEKLPDVERAFVHLDYEKEHNPACEHKVGTLF